MAPSTFQGVTVNSSDYIHDSVRLRFKKSFWLFVVMSQVLHPIEQKILTSLLEKQNLTPEELSEKTKLSIDQVRRGIEWLRFKDLIQVNDSEKHHISLGHRGIEASEKGLPERQLINYLKSLFGFSCEINEAKNQLKDEFSAAIANAKKNGWIEIHKNRILLKGYHDVIPEERLIKTIASRSPAVVSIDEIEDKTVLDSLKKRPEFLILNSTKHVTINLTEKGAKLASQASNQTTNEDLIRAIDVEAPSHTIFAARSNPLEEAKRMVLRTHTTCVTIKNLADQKYDEARLFSIGRVFRNEKVSYKHLVEFNQVEGVVVGKKVTLRDLMGLQMEFYRKMGIKKAKFWPTFFPYTEPSLQSMIYNERLVKWVELFGMGILSHEVT